MQSSLVDHAQRSRSVRSDSTATGASLVTRTSRPPSATSAMSDHWTKRTHGMVIHMCMRWWCVSHQRISNCGTRVADARCDQPRIDGSSSSRIVTRSLHVHRLINAVRIRPSSFQMDGSNSHRQPNQNQNRRRLRRRLRRLRQRRLRSCRCRRSVMLYLQITSRRRRLNRRQRCPHQAPVAEVVVV